MSRVGPAGVLVAALVVTGFLVAGPSPAGGHHAADSALGAQEQIDSDTVLLDVSLQPDGDARWEIRYRVRLDDDNATAAFASLERDVEDNESAYANRFAGRIERTVAAAENATGREMTVRNVSVRTTRQEIPQRYGVLVYAFEWTGFAATDGPRLRVGDAIGGLFLDESTSLTVRWPEGYGLASPPDPEPDEAGAGSVTWRGPADFAASQPSVVVSSQAPPTTASERSDNPLSSTSTALLGVAGLAVLVAGWWWYRRRQPTAPTGGEADSSPDDSAPPDELLSNEERVLRLLREHGGRMKQQQVVEELGWTDAKTSQVVGELRESGEVEGFRLGRENVLRLPGEDEEPGP